MKRQAEWLGRIIFVEDLMGSQPAKVQVSRPHHRNTKGYDPLVFIYGGFRLHYFVVVPFMKLLI